MKSNFHNGKQKKKTQPDPQLKTWQFLKDTQATGSFGPPSALSVEESPKDGTIHW